MTRFVERLGRHHDRRRLRSGRDELDAWFWHVAGQADRRHDSARVWVLCDDEIEGGRRPLGYYSLVAHAVTPDDASEQLRRGQPREIPM
jgi:hypothetical protein